MNQRSDQPETLADARALIAALSEGHSARVTELLQANNREVERRRKAERDSALFEAERAAATAHAERADQALEAARVALTRAAEQFSSYCRQHRAKRTPEADAKAEVNAQMVTMMRGAIFDLPSPMPQIARPEADWHEDLGDVVWWYVVEGGRVEEAPWVGSPLDQGYTVELRDPRGTLATAQVGGWPGYHTHFTLLPKELPTFLPAPVAEDAAHG